MLVGKTSRADLAQREKSSQVWNAECGLGRAQLAEMSRALPKQRQSVSGCREEGGQVWGCLRKGYDFICEPLLTCFFIPQIFICPCICQGSPERHVCVCVCVCTHVHAEEFGYGD